MNYNLQEPNVINSTLLSPFLNSDIGILSLDIKVSKIFNWMLKTVENRF